MTWIAGAAVVAAGCLVGCGGDDSNGQGSSSSSSTQSTTSGSSSTSKSGSTTSTTSHASTTTSGSSNSTTTTRSSTTTTTTSSSSSTTAAQDAGPDATLDSGATSDAAPDSTIADASSDGSSDATTSADATEDAADAALCVTNWPTDGGANIVTNPDFESGVAGWAAIFGGGTMEASTAVHHCGAQSGEYGNRTASYQAFGYALPTTPMTYNVALWVYQDGPFPQPMAVGQLLCPTTTADGGVKNTYPGGQFPTVLPNTWTFVSESLTVPAGCNSVTFYVGQNGAPTGADGGIELLPDGGGAVLPDLFVDDVFITPQ